MTEVGTGEALNLDELKALCAAATEGPWYAVDCEGELSVWRESALTHVHRNDAGEITGYSTPGSYFVLDQIAKWELLDSWDEGEEPEDDQRRATARFIAAARSAVPALVAEVERLRAQRDEALRELNGAPLNLQSALLAAVLRASRVLSRTEDGTNDN